MPGRSQQSRQPRYFVGLDLGQQNDFTAICVLERIPRPDESDGPELHIRHLERFRDVLYPDVAERVAGLMGSPQLAGDARLLVDATGVGPAVTDIFTKRGLAFTGVHVHGGESVTRSGGVVRVPKRDLVYALLATFQSGRLRIAASLELAPTLKAELLNFKIKTNATTGHDSYEAWRENDHDDLVFAASLTAWAADRTPRPARHWGRGARQDAKAAPRTYASIADLAAHHRPRRR